MPKMKVFLAWSGPRSKAVATALRKWLPNVIQDLDPWMSDHDIAKGANWQLELSDQFQNVRIGILCLTPQNLKEPWINFEAGALSKLEGSYACTYLHGLETTDVSGPLAQFQATKSNKEDTKQLIQTLNEQLGESALESSRLNETFDKWWDDLEEALKKAKDLHVQQPPKRETDDMLKEILATLRSHADSNAAIQHFLTDIRTNLFAALGRSPMTPIDSNNRSKKMFGKYYEEFFKTRLSDKDRLLLRRMERMMRENVPEELLTDRMERKEEKEREEPD